MSIIRIIFILFALTTFASSSDKMEDYMENCVDDYYEKFPNTEKVLDSIVLDCGFVHDTFKTKFYYYKGKIYSKPKR